ncbi:MAG: BNR repeat-containing protein [Caldilineaceae bacterium]
MTHAKVVSVLEVDRVWAGHPVDFGLLTVGDRQFVAYYGADRQMTVAVRRLNESSWQRFAIPSAQTDAPGYKAATTSTRLGWDSHNSVTLAADADGYLHLSGNMHVNALTYFRTEQPWEITSFVQHFAMTGENEERCTYPHFLTDHKGELIFHYRDGSSGNGSEIYNRWDRAARRWGRRLDRPLTDGRGQMNAYLHEPVLGPDGRFHLSWVWRNTPDCRTNHDLSYAVSDDLVHWQTATGESIELPMNLQTPGVIVDPIPAEGGIINGSGKVGFDSQARVILTYHKFDAAGNTQAYNARWEEDGWRFYQTSDWRYRWWFEGGGSIVNDVVLGQVTKNGDGRLALDFRHVEAGAGRWILDEATLHPVETLPPAAPLPAHLMTPESDFPEMQVHLWEDDGHSPDPSVRYLLRWETLPAHRDRPRTGPLPEPSALRLYEIAV